MKKQLWLLAIFCFSFFYLFAQPISENINEITIFDSSLNKFKGSQNEISILENFPKDAYDICKVPKLGSFYIDRIDDCIKGFLRSGKIWEPKLEKLIKKYVVPNSTVIDIGAHIGSHTLTLSKYAGNGGKVYAFEPQIKIFRELVMNIKLNDCHNIIAFRAAVGNGSGVIQMMKAAGGNEGGTGFGIGGDFAQILSLDQLALKDNISLIKIDVENSEYQVLLGAKETIAKNRPVIILEIMGNSDCLPKRSPEMVIKTIQLLKEMGYRVTNISGDDYLAIPN
jgi:FkbM family methyltransferase